MHATSPHSTSPVPRRLRHGFSLTELLVVIAIIVLLVGLLLVALSTVQRRSRQTQTEATMNQFANACAAFQAEHGIYPGVIPEGHLAFANRAFSSTENALLHLMGGYRAYSSTEAGTQSQADYDSFVLADPANVEEILFNHQSGSWRLAVNLRRIGEGPVINGKSYAPYLTPSADQLNVAQGQVGPDDPMIPDLVDAWGQPIIYLRQIRGRGPLLLDPSSSIPPQYDSAGSSTYIQSCGLGELAQSQVPDFAPGCSPMPGENFKSSVFNIGTSDQKNRVWAAILSHPAFYKSPSSSPPGNPLLSTARGSFALISAGPDGVFFSRSDGPGDPSNPITDLTEIITGGPKVIDEFDDVRVYGGG